MDRCPLTKPPQLQLLVHVYHQSFDWSWQWCGADRGGRVVEVHGLILLGVWATYWTYIHSGVILHAALPWSLHLGITLPIFLLSLSSSFTLHPYTLLVMFRLSSWPHPLLTWMSVLQHLCCHHVLTMSSHFHPCMVYDDASSQVWSIVSSYVWLLGLALCRLNMWWLKTNVWVLMPSITWCHLVSGRFL
jgi:hypothetical protein